MAEPSLAHASLRDLLGDVHAVFGWRLLALFALMVIAAMLESLGMALLLPLLQAVGLGSALGGSGVLSSVLGQLGAAQSIGGSLLMVLGALVVQGGVQIVQHWYIASMQREYGAHWQEKLSTAILRAKWIFFGSQKQGELTNMVAYETIRLAGAFQVFCQLVATVIVAVTYMVLASLLSWQMTLALGVFAVTLFALLKGIARRNYRIGLTLGPLQGDLTVLLSEAFASSKLIKATATEAFVSKQLARVFDALRRAHTLATFLPALTRSLFEFLSLVALCCLLVTGYQWLEIPAAIMILVLALFVRLLPRANAFLQNLQLISTYLPALGSVRQRWAQAVAHAENAVENNGVTWPEGASLQIDIERAEYDGKAALCGVGLSLPPAGFVGIVGPSGSGKTTLLNCLLGLVPIKQGELRAGDVVFSDAHSRAWRQAIGLVPQDSQLFHLTIAENIAWGDPTPDMARVRIAAQKAQAHEFIEAQPDGYRTVIGDQGMRLSGGQRQRLGLARALYRQPRILLLDEATSALDSNTEAAVLQTINLLREEMCVVSVAHRLASVRGADHIVVLDRGRVAELGTWDDLIAAKGLFHSLAVAQHVTASEQIESA